MLLFLVLTAQYAFTHVYVIAINLFVCFRSTDVTHSPEKVLGPFLRYSVSKVCRNNLELILGLIFMHC